MNNVKRHGGVGYIRTMESYTAFVKFKNHPDYEQVDVVAANSKEARKKVQAVLDADYEPGGEIKVIMSSVLAGGGWIHR